MKKINISLMALLGTAMLVASCSNETEQLASPAGTKQVTFNATQETTGVTSRTAFSDDGKHINWVKDNKVAICDDKGTAASDFTVTVDPTDATKASLAGTVTEEATKFIAVYPNSAAATDATYSFAASDGDKKTIDKVTIPTKQTATANTFDPDAAVMTAYAKSSTEKEINATLDFKNVCAFIKLTTTKAYKSITVKTTTADIAGQFQISDADAGTLGTVVSGQGSKAITLKGASSGSSADIAAGTYYICAAPYTASESYTIECVDANDKTDTYKTAGTTAALTRNQVFDLGKLGYDLNIETATIYTGSYDNIQALTFANVKNETEFTVVNSPTTTDEIVAEFYKDKTCTDANKITLSDNKGTTTGTIYVKANKAGTATVTIGGATATITVKNPTVALSKTIINSGESLSITHQTYALKDGGDATVKRDGSDENAATTDYTITNNHDGTYTFTGLKAGTYQVIINGVTTEAITVNAAGGGAKRH